MIDTLPARPWMAHKLKTQAAQLSAGEITPAEIEAAIGRGPAYACMRAGEVIAIGGVVEQWPGRGMLWGVLSDSIRASMPVVHRVVAKGLADSPHERIEAHVLESFTEAHRWIGLLGFQREGLMRRFWRGEDYALYALVRG